MIRGGLVVAVFGMAVAWGQTALELDVRTNMRLERKGAGVPEREKGMWSERISVRGPLIRLAAADQMVILNTENGTALVGRGSDGSYVRTTTEDLAAMLAKAKRSPMAEASSARTVEMLEAPAAPPFAWSGGATEGFSCRVRITMRAPTGKVPVVTDTTIHFYTVPMAGEVAKVLAATERFRMTRSAAELESVDGCRPKGRMAVRTESVTEVRGAAEGEWRMRWESVFTVDLLPAAELGPEFFRIPEGWTEGPAESLEERVRQYVKGWVAMP